MKMKNSNLTIISGGVIAAAFLRAMMAPLPNIEPILLLTLVAALSFGPVYGFMFAFMAMIIGDFFIGLPGTWTLYTASTYGLVGFMTGLIGLWKNKWSRIEVTLLAAAMVIFFDVTTAFFWSINFMVPYQAALLAQIPFTEMHLISTMLVFMFAPSLLKNTEKLKAEFATRKLSYS